MNRCMGVCVLLCVTLVTFEVAAQATEADESEAGDDAVEEAQEAAREELDPAEEVEQPEHPRGAKNTGGATPIPSDMNADDLVGDEVIEENGDEVMIEVQRTTPVIPEDPDTAPRRAYQLYYELDLPILGAGAALAAARLFRTGEGAPHASCLNEVDSNGDIVRRTSCDPNDINAFDRLVAGRYNRSWARVSDYGLLSLAVAPPVLLIAHDGLLVGLNDLVVVYESALWAAAFSGIATLGGSRARPYVYGEEAPVSTRTSGNGSLSFVSSHTSVAFALATSTFWTVERRHGGGELTWVVFVTGLSAASLVGVSRVLAGSHFPTDVIAGAVVGMSTGTVLPMLHGSPVRVSASAGPEQAEANLTYTF